jgi:hypothetical protein
MKKLLLLLLCVPLMFSCGDTDNLDKEITEEMLDEGYTGKGTRTYANDSFGIYMGSYVGEFKDGKRHGLGTYTYASSEDKYVGEWKDDKRHGQGTYTWGKGQ